MGADIVLTRRSYSRDGKNPKAISASLLLGSKSQKKDDEGKLTRNPKVISASHLIGSKVQKKNDKVKSTQRNHALKNSTDVTKSRTSVSIGISQNSSFRSSRRSAASLSGATCDEELKRVSIYQSSESAHQMSRMGALQGTRKIQWLRNSDSFLTFTVIDSSSRPNLVEVSPATKKNKPKTNSCNVYRKSTSIGLNYILPTSPEMHDWPHRLPEEHSFAQNSYNGFLEIPLDCQDLNKAPKFESSTIFAPENDGNILAEGDIPQCFSKFDFMKLEMPGSPYPGELYQTQENSEDQTSQLQKVLCSTAKSKSLQNKSLLVEKTTHPPTTGSDCIKKNEMLRRSLLQDFSEITNTPQCNGQLFKPCHSSVKTSPVHLHGLLRLKHKHGLPSFEFSLNDMDDVLVAKTWRMNDAFKWVYTFYSVNSKRKDNSIGRRKKDRCCESTMVGQMHASCYLCSEMKDASSFHNSAVMECALYDIAHAKKNFALHGHCTNDYGNTHLSVPWASNDLHPSLEVAAIVVHIPFEKKGHLMNEMGDKVADAISNRICPVNVKVITASGTHGAPNKGEGMPLPLLKRWQLNGACDCGGWDIACPVKVFDNLSVKNVEDSSLPEKQQPLELFSQGGKEEVPAFSISFIEEGRYSVDFHAQLSAMQAFAVSVALLHNVDDPSVTRGESPAQKLQCKSLKSLFQEELRILAEAGEEKTKVAKRKEGISRHLAINRSFSPLGRV